jgi:hypothetical protein
VGGMSRDYRDLVLAFTQISNQRQRPARGNGGSFSV